MAVAINQHWDYRWEGLPRHCEFIEEIKHVLKMDYI